MAKIRSREPEKYIIMLAHRNDRLDMWAELKVPAVLCGHGHGGLIRLPFTDGLIGPGRELFPEYTAGIYERDGTKMLVSRGVGGEKLRFMNNPQIAVAVFEHG